MNQNWALPSELASEHRHAWLMMSMAEALPWRETGTFRVNLRMCRLQTRTESMDSAKGSHAQGSVRS